MKPDAFKSKISEVKSRASTMTSKQKKTLGLSVGAVLLVILVGALSVSALSNAAGDQARAFDKELNEYVSRLTATNKSITQLKPIVTEAPKLKTSMAGWLSDDYKKAEAKQAVLTVHQDEVLNYIPKFDGSEAYKKVLDARTVYNNRYNQNIPDSTKETSRPLDVKFVKQKALLQSSSRLDTMYPDFRKAIEALDTGTYGERGKQYLLSLVDSGMKLEREYAANIKKADTYADVRSLNKQHMIQMRFADYEPNYGVAALFGMNSLPAYVSAPAVASLKYTLDQTDEDTVEEAKERAYATLYGYTASYNTPRSTDQDAVVLNKLGLATYSLDRLSRLLKDSDNDALKSRVETTKKAFALLPYGNSASKIPSAGSRMDSLSEINGGLSSFDGYSDIVYDLEQIGTSGNRINGARVDFAAYDKLRDFARSAYPSALFPDEVKEYRRTVDICIGGYMKYHRAGEKVIEAQIKQAQKVATISKEIRQISDDDSARLQELRKQVQSATAEVNRLQNSLKPAEAQSRKDIANCGKEFVPAVQNLRAKTDNLPGMYSKSSSLARETYQKL